MENQPSTQESWRQSQETYQSMLDDQMAELSDVVSIWNSHLRVAAESGNGELVEELKDQALKSLNEKWQWYRDYFIVTGKWYAPVEQEVSEGSFMYEHAHSDALHMAQSLGFVDVPAGKHSEWPQVALSFSRGCKVEFNQSGVKGEVELLYFAKLDEVSMTYLRPDTLATITAEMGEFSKKLSQVSAVLETQMTDPDSDFYRASAVTQKEFLSSAVEEMNGVMPAPEDIDRVVLDVVYIPKVYKVNPSNSQDLEVYNLPDDQMIILGGRVLGFTAIELHRDDKAFPFRSPEDLVDHKAGICMIVEVIKENINMQITDETEQFLVPVGSATGLSLKIF